MFQSKFTANSNMPYELVNCSVYELSYNTESSNDGKKTWQDIIMREHLMVLKPTPYHTFSSPNLDIPHTIQSRDWAWRWLSTTISL